jgi:hypothetical protein
MLERLVAATGFELDVQLRRGARGRPLAAAVTRHRRRILRIIAAHGPHDVRLFDGVARGEETAERDVPGLAAAVPRPTDVIAEQWRSEEAGTASSPTSARRRGGWLGCPSGRRRGGRR